MGNFKESKNTFFYRTPLDDCFCQEMFSRQLMECVYGKRDISLGAVQKGHHRKNSNFWIPLLPMSPLVTISGYPPPPCHRVNSDKLSLRMQVTKTIWGHFKNSKYVFKIKGLFLIVS